MITPGKYSQIFLIILAVGITLLSVGLVCDRIVILGVGLLIAFGSFVFRVITYRCPHCGYYLGRQRGTHCPRCKEEIRQ